ncbi:hypothetical protein HLK59_31690 [Streptomyces sp. S3(2020)]|uniref:hypothetical protein n=1 Tax=Streptomyces sp. S3(2020) TaxID=2732044 RepID=UPI00148940B5|nr:hypothetical protein [Streptomyces sp. S3(2020)]NNN34847.1 hypothetical protein [Streptomyces sp. S3(2020)]
MDLPSSLTGYAMPGHGIAPAEHLLGLPGFWPAYFGPVWHGLANEPEPFGADAADVDAAAEALYEATETWPAFRIPLHGGRLLWVVHRNFPDDAGTDYLLTRPDHPRETLVAAIEGHQSGPGFSWPDLVSVADSVPPDAEGVCDPDQRLLLLLPAFGDANVPEGEGVARISRALTTVGVSGEAAYAMADRFLDHPLWPAPSWPGPDTSPLSGGGDPGRSVPLGLLSSPSGTA